MSRLEGRWACFPPDILDHFVRASSLHEGMTQAILSFMVANQIRWSYLPEDEIRALEAQLDSFNDKFLPPEKAQVILDEGKERYRRRDRGVVLVGHVPVCLLTAFEAYKRSDGDEEGTVYGESFPPAPAQDPLETSDSFADVVLDGKMVDPDVAWISEEELMTKTRSFADELAERIDQPEKAHYIHHGYMRELRSQFTSNRSLAVAPKIPSPRVEAD